MKERINKMDFIKLYNICSAKDTVKSMRKQATRWEKIFPKDVSDKGLSSNSTIKNEQSNWLINGQKPLQITHQKDIKIANKQTSLSYIISENDNDISSSLNWKLKQDNTPHILEWWNPEHWQDQMLARLWSNRKSHSLLIECNGLWDVHYMLVGSLLGPVM